MVFYNIDAKSKDANKSRLEANILLVTDSSSEEDSEADDQSYYHPWGVCSNLAGLYYSYHAYVVLQCLVFTSYTQYWMPSP